MFKMKQITGNWPVVMIRCTAPDKPNDLSMESTILAGYCSYIDGKVKPIDGDSYSVEDTYSAAETFVDEDGELILVLTFRANWVSG